MAKLWNSLIEKLSGSTEGRERTRARRQRNLRMESLERREVFDITIAGVVYNDINNNATQDLPGDVPLAGAQVALFRDTNNDSQFDTGDVQVGTTQTTLADGRYSFVVTQADRYFVRQQNVLTGFTQQATQKVQTVNILGADLTATSTISVLDSFDLPTPATPAGQLATSTTQNTVATATFSNASIIGGSRDITAEVTSALGSLTNQVSVNLGANNGLQIVGTSGTDGTARIIYDGSGGTDANPQTADGSFTAQDLTSNGTASGLRLRVSRDNSTGATIRINARSTSGTSSTAAIAIPTGALADFDFPFTGAAPGAFSGTADFTQITALEIVVVSTDTDVDLDALGTFGNVRTVNIANTTAVSIGNLVFLDRNNNGTFDTSGANPDVGIGGVDLQLFNDVNNNQLFDAGTDTAVTVGTSTTVSSSTVGTLGQYSFTGLLPGNYIVLVPASEFGAGQPLVNRVSSAGVGTADVNNTDKGEPVSATFGAAVFAAVGLTVNGEPPAGTDGDDTNTNSTIDFGFAPPNLTLTKADTPDPVRTGEQLTYTVTVTNNSPAGTASSTATTITDTLPAGLTLVGTPSYVISNPAGTNGNATFDPNNRLLSANVLSLAPGQIATLTVIATVGASFGSGANPVPNTASVTNAEGSIATNNTTTTQLPDVDLGITKTIVGGVTSVNRNGTLSYTLTVTNRTATTVTNIRVDDNLPAGFTLGTVTAPVGSTAVAGADPADLIWTINSLAGNGGTATLTVPITSVGTTLGVNTNTATIRTDLLVGFNELGSTSPNLPNSAAVPVTVVDPRYNLGITKTDGLTSVTAGQAQNVTYTITVRNTGAGEATNVNVLDTLPAGLQYISHTVNGITTPAVGDPATVNIAVGTLAAGASRDITFVVRVRPNATGTLNNGTGVGNSIVNRALATADNAGNELDASDNENTDINTLVQTFDLSVTKTVNTPTVNTTGLNPQLVYTIIVTNSGPSTATNVNVSDILPAQLAFVSATGVGGVVFTNSNGVGQNGTVSGTIPTLASGTPATITLTTSVINAPPNGTVITNPVVVSATGETSVLPNNASVNATVANTSSLSGQVYIDANGNATRENGEQGIANVTITATGIEQGTGATITRTEKTNANGLYTFANLPLGTYTITQTQPVDFNNNRAIAGTGAGGVGGTNNQVTGVVLVGAPAVAYDFPETQLISKRQLLATTAPTPVRVAVNGASRGIGAIRRN